MAQVVYESTTGNISAVFDDSVVLPTLPTGYANLAATGNVNDLVDKHVDISGPSIEERDYPRITGPDTQDVSTVDTHGIQKVNGNTDVDMVAAGDNELSWIQIGDELMQAGPAGFFQSNSENLTYGAATYKLASGNVTGPLSIFAKFDNSRIVSKAIAYV